MTGRPKDLTEYQVVTQNLKRAIKDRGLTYRDIAQGVGLSESGVKKIFLAKDGSFQRLAQICRFIGFSVSELVEDSRTLEVGFSESQQQEFMKETKLFHLYWLLVYERKSVVRSQEVLKLTRAESFRLLRKLDTLGLIKLLPRDHIRLPSVKAVRWVGEGVFVRKLYQEWSRSLVDALAKPGPQKEYFFLLRYLQMTSETYAEFKTALASLEEEFVRRSIHEMRTQPSKVGHVRWLVAVDNRSFVTMDS